MSCCSDVLSGTISLDCGRVTNGISAGALQVTNKQYVTNQTYAGTTSTAFVSSGIGAAAIAPNMLGELSIELFADIFNDTLNDGVVIAIYRNTTGVPVAGTSVGTDTQVWSSNSSYIQQGTANKPNKKEYARIFDTGLTNGGSGYYYYIAVKALTGGTAKVSNLYMYIREQ